jgi:hypothetical protein
VLSGFPPGSINTPPRYLPAIGITVAPISTLRWGTRTSTDQSDQSPADGGGDEHRGDHDHRRKWRFGPTGAG